MPPSLEIAAFVLGGVLILLGLVSGGFKIFGAEISGTAGKLSRVTALVLGLGLVGIGMWRHDARPEASRPPDESPPPPAHPAPRPEPQRPVAGPAPAPREQPPADRPTKPVTTPASIDGIWRDNTGTVFEVNQTGDTFIFSGLNASSGIRSFGRGTVRGTQFRSTFQTSAPSTGTGRGEISADGRVLTGTFDDSVVGTYTLVLVKQ